MRKVQILFVLLLVWFVPLRTAQGATLASGTEWSLMVIGLFGGLALFLYGMEKMTEALKAVAGERMKFVLEKLTSNRFTGAFTGALVTAVIQSSSVTTVLVVGFVSAGLMSLGQSIGVIMGANIGTTITAQIVAFKVDELALLLIAAGFALLFLPRHERGRSHGGIIMGLVFYGMNVMSDAMLPLRTFAPFLDFMTQMENPLIGIAVGALFTALVQSSSATTGIVIVMASQGFITLQARNRKLLVDVEKMDDDADALHVAIARYLSRLAKQPLTEVEQAEFTRLSHAVNHLEGVGDLIEKDLVSIGHKMILENLHPSATMWPLLTALHDDVVTAFELAVRSVSENDPQAACEVMDMKRQIQGRVDAALQRQVTSLAGSEETRLATLRVEFEMIDRFNRIYSKSKRVAQLNMPHATQQS